MTILRSPGLGPIIGHTTATTCRLWIRASDPVDKGAELADERRTVGIIGVLDDSADQVLVAYYFRLHREYDRTGTFVLGQDISLGRQPPARRSRGHSPDRPFTLKPDQSCRVRLATLTLDDPWPNDAAVSDQELARRLPDVMEVAGDLLRLPPQECEVRLRTFPASDRPADHLSFLLGSCRYPGLLWKVKEADRIFAPMQRQFADGEATDPVRFTLMVGDQIYADTLNRLIPLGRADTFEEFQSRYHQTFGAINMRRLLKSAPTYMILDDHEIEDNWTQDRLEKACQHELYNLAIGSYMSYQWSHGPRTYGSKLFYRFDCAGYPFFVLDTRTQRYKDDEEGLWDNHMLGRPTIDPAHPGQLKLLLDWLSRQQETRGNIPKFIVTASVFVPNPISERMEPDLLPGELKERGPSGEALLYEANRRRREKSDSWPAYPETRLAILRHIVDKGIQNVVFLSGDIHCACIARLEFDGIDADKQIFAYDVTSSALYWPFPFADGDPNAYVHDSRKKRQTDTFPIVGTKAVMNYRAWGFSQEDNFCRLTVDKAGKSLQVRVFDRQGDPVKVTDDQGKMVQVNVLPLAGW